MFVEGHEVILQAEAVEDGSGRWRGGEIRFPLVNFRQAVANVATITVKGSVRCSKGVLRMSRPEDRREVELSFEPSSREGLYFSDFTAMLDLGQLLAI